MAVINEISVGVVVRIQNWHGVVLEMHHDDAGRLSVIKVQTARNVFRGLGPELIDVRLDPQAIQPATLADLEQEIGTHHRVLDEAVSRMLAAVTRDDP